MGALPSPTESREIEPALEVHDLVKSFGGVAAVTRGELSVLPGEVHVLIGANGCGKSTLCKVVAGALSADGGVIRLSGKGVAFATPIAARAAGIGAVYQETSLIPTLTVEENLLLGVEPRNMFGLIDRRKRRALAQELVQKAGADLAAGIRLKDRISDLSVDKHQIVEILRVVGRDPDVIIFDEATASLDRFQLAAFFALVRTLRSAGKAIIFISHRMEEIFAIGDRVTVMRNGEWIATRRLTDTQRSDLVRLIVGGDLAHAPVAAHRRLKAGSTILRVTDLSGAILQNVSFELSAGEILGLGGLHGQGQSNLLLTLFGTEKMTSGALTVHDRPMRFRRPTDAVRQGFAYVSGDRGRAGAFLARPVFENLVLVCLRKDRSFFLRPTALMRSLGSIVDRLRLRFPSLSSPLSALSGGNQQKVIIGRWLAAGPRILLLDDPTKGVDIQAKRDFYDLLGELCREGLSVILYSSEDAELLEAADRILVFNHGRIVQELVGGAKTEFDLYAAALKSA